jgi:excisionase family DNA binding protein
MSVTMPARQPGTARPDTAAGTRHHATGPDDLTLSAGLATDVLPGRKLYRIPEVMRLLSLSRSVIYNQIRLGRLRSVKEGSARLIPADAITEYVALLEAEAEADR